MALVQYNDGGTHDITTTINDDVWVDFEAPGMGTTVNVLSGGSIPDPYGLHGFNNANLNVSDGTVRYMSAYNSSHVTLLGGIINTNLFAYDNSQVTMSGGRVENRLYARDNSHVTLSGGAIGYELVCWDSGQVTMSGGTIADAIQLDDQANLIIYGVDFAIDGTPVDYGNITSFLGGSYVNEPFRTLTGTLENGDIINNQFRIGHTAKITLAPPPGIFTLTIATEPNDIGIDTITPSIGEHNYGGVVDITAEGFPDCPHTWPFDHWDGDVADPNSAITTVDMDADKTITAFFTRQNPTCGDVCHPILKGDLNQDCHVNMQDFRIWADDWMICTHPSCD